MRNQNQWELLSRDRRVGSNRLHEHAQGRINGGRIARIPNCDRERLTGGIGHIYLLKPYAYRRLCRGQQSGQDHDEHEGAKFHSVLPGKTHISFLTARYLDATAAVSRSIYFRWLRCSGSSTRVSSSKSGGCAFIPSIPSPYVTPHAHVPAFRAVRTSTSESPTIIASRGAAFNSRKSVSVPIGCGFFFSKLLPP